MSHLRDGDLFLVDIPMSSLWHEKHGHLSKVGIMHLSRAAYIPKLSFSDHQFCEHCQYSNNLTPYDHTERIKSTHLVHSNVCGLMPYQSLNGAFYFVTFIDDSTRKVWAYLARTKARVFSIFQEWLAIVKNKSIQTSSLPTQEEST